MDLNKTLKELCLSGGVSGDEKSCAELCCRLLSQYTDDITIDSFNNVIAHIKRGKDKTLLLDAHLDMVGLVVTYIDEQGFIKFSKCGGIDGRSLFAQTVTIHGKENIKGIVSVLPPHVKSKSDEIPDIGDMVIDTGYTKEQLSNLIMYGDSITIDSEYNELLNGRVSAPAIDDRAGVAAILYALELIKDKECAYNIDVCFSSQEEGGEVGAKISSYKLNPDIIIECDVSFAVTPDDKPYECGKMSKGVMIGISPSLSRKMSYRLIDIAKEENIPYQLEVMSDGTGTNADVYTVSMGGCISSTLSVPIKYMHMPVESVDIEDIKSTGRLMAEFCVKGGI